ncbi:nucleoside triphosphate pyrophosphohydrolase [Heyndrickxia sp. NPDC080065]|uniref:nucleoside triphosphate pyrophosphohydrolase n=1 Tax=Heyndrickxia sp. NPDC080065 TaxID=3390568 RepID=UPI003D05A083
MPIYNKLVRDNIPEIIKSNGKTPKISTLSDEEYIIELKKKSIEEIQEYIETSNDNDALEELADVLEIIHACAKIHNADFDKVEAIRREKAEHRGGFEKKTFLFEVEE